VKRMKILRALMISVMAAVLAIAIPVSPALAAGEEISVDPTSAEVGEYVGVEGNDFDESGDVVEDFVYVSLYFAADEADPGDEIGNEVDTYRKVDSGILVDNRGDFDDGRFKIPSTLTSGTDDEDVHGGTYYIYATYGDDEIVAVDEFTVIAGEITLDPDEGTVGTPVDIEGKDFAGNEDLTFEYAGDDVTDDIEGDDDTDSDGEFTSTIIVPKSTAGDHTIKVTGDEGSEAEATFTVEPEVAVSPLKAPPGDPVTISGTGFGYKADVDITLCNVEFKNATDTDSDGSFSVQLDVPDVDEGIWDIDAEDEDGNDATVKFTVEKGTAVTINPITSASLPGHVGQSVTLSGVAFNPISPVTITYTSTPQTVATTTSDANGAFTATFPIPESVAGSHTITASDGTNSLQVEFYMESQAPDIPPPLLPQMGAKAKALTYFDWEDVTDPSGVTYTLQVATSEDFTPASIVLVQEGLIASEYTVTEEDKLPSRSKEEPYFWRVKAVDGASNPSGWTGTGQFYVGMSMPDWTIHLWWGLGCLGAGLGCYWLGKRRAYYY